MSCINHLHRWPTMDTPFYGVFHRFSQKTWLPLLVLCALLLSLSSPSLAFAQHADEEGSNGIEDLKTRTQDLEQRRRIIRMKKQENLRKVRDLNVTIYANQQKLEWTKRSRYSTEQQIHDTEVRMSRLKNSIDETLGETTRLEVDAGVRLRSLYMGERLSHIQMILDAKDLASLLDRAFYRQQLVNQDKDLIENLRNKYRQLQVQLKEHAIQRANLDRMMSQLSIFQGQISNQLSLDRELRNKYKTDAAYYERAERELLNESARIRAQILALTRRAGSQKVANSTGRFLWPVSGKITSGFGYRFHPIHRKRTMHTGLDISRAQGTPVAASDGGTVIYAGWRGGYGKVIMINHGNQSGRNMVTLYAHLSSIGVSMGQSVSKGQIVGKVGTTGFSTGPHLHFEIRINGSPVNPLSYL